MTRRLNTGRLLAIGMGVALSVLCVLLASTRPVDSLPQYSARAARTCDNCHVSPTGWEDPALLERQCSLACVVCHVDPTGGGMRTVSGNYYGIQTLSALGATRRPYGGDTWYVSSPEWGDPPPEHDGEGAPESQPTGMPTTMSSGGPEDEEDGPDDGRLGVAAFGSPLGGSSIYAFEQGRYGGLVADPLFAIGADLRLAFYFNQGTFSFFPMQGDLSLLLHPVEHLSFVVEGGAQGSRSGLGEPVDGEEVDRFGLHEAFVMTHEWPGNAYLKVGRFIPPFGTRLDDHTAFVRRTLGFDQGRPSSYVAGAEIGGVANYPYFHAAVFRTHADENSFFPGDTGTGFSAMGGWRDLAWGVGGSIYQSLGDEESDEGDRRMGGLNWYLNPWRLWWNVPITYLGEVDLVHLAPSADQRTIQQLVAFHEIDFAIKSGFTFATRYDFEDPDLDVAEDERHKLTFRIDLFPYRWTEIQLVFRTLFPAAGHTDADFIGILRGWY